jgi:16S rRNA (cytosine1402-N4)-methyltransferase
VIEGFSYPGQFLDVTFGGGGHSQALLNAHDENTVWAFDRDSRAIERGKYIVDKFKGRLTLMRGSFSMVESLVQDKNFDGVIADLGMSTDQLYEQRGFSFRDDAKLDMRMDESDDLTANVILNNYSRSDLLRVMRDGGVSAAVVVPLVAAVIQNRPILSTKQLVEIIVKTIFVKKKEGAHPATVVFQALRMEVNRELVELKALLGVLPKIINSGGRAMIISFHSLEDKLVARQMRLWAQGDTRPARLVNSATGPLVQKLGSLITRKAITPGEEEIDINPASRSARMRIFSFY